MTLEEEQKIAEAFGYLQRYELHQLLRALGAMLIILGLGYFSTSSVLVLSVWTLLDSWLRLLPTGLTDEQEEVVWRLLLDVRLIILTVIAIVVLCVMIGAYFSVTKTRTKNQEIVTKPMRLFGLSLLLLFAFTFHDYGLAAISNWLVFQSPIAVIWVVGFLSLLPMYLPEVLAVFLAYRMLRVEVGDYRFGELRNLGFALLKLCIAELSWRMFFLVALNPLGALLPSPFQAFLMIFYYYCSYLVLESVLLLLYVRGGWQNWRRAGQVLEGTSADS
jgi:hypothetical protein